MPDDDATTFARVERWLAKFAAVPVAKWPPGARGCDFLIGIIDYQREQLERLRNAMNMIKATHRDAVGLADEVERITREQPVSYRTIIQRKDAK